MLTGNEKVDHILAIAGALVPLLSAVSSLFNHIIRRLTEEAKPVSPVLSGAGTIVNLAAVNLDKAIQLAKMARDSLGGGTAKALPSSSNPPVNPTPES